MHVLSSTVVIQKLKIKNMHRCIRDVSFSEKGKKQIPKGWEQKLMSLAAGFGKEQ